MPIALRENPVKTNSGRFIFHTLNNDTELCRIHYRKDFKLVSLTLLNYGGKLSSNNIEARILVDRFVLIYVFSTFLRLLCVVMLIV